MNSPKLRNWVQRFTGYCVWNSLGSQPRSAEMEVTVLGPGHGESIVVHLGRGEWLIVDSCVDASDDQKRSAPLKYLRSLGVQVETAVKLVVVTHWDDDHVRGIAEVVETCSSARVCCSTALTQREFTEFVEKSSVGATATDGAGVRNFRRVFQLLIARGGSIVVATPGRQLLRNPKVRSWSPSDHEAMLFLQFLAQREPKGGQSLRRAVLGSPNLTSVVLSIEWDDVAVWLGADMEFHTDNRRGWGAVVSEARIVGFVPGNMVKVPHHGSHTGHDDRMWTDLLQQKPISVIAPFGRGALNKRPPKSADVKRINDLSSATYLTAGREQPNRPKMDFAVKRSLREGNISLVSQKTPLGIVQLRRMPGGQWQHALFGAARRAK